VRASGASQAAGASVDHSAKLACMLACARSSATAALPPGVWPSPGPPTGPLDRPPVAAAAPAGFPHAARPRLRPPAIVHPNVTTQSEHM
jgi:hypothetical protein